MPAGPLQGAGPMWQAGEQQEAVTEDWGKDGVSRQHCLRVSCIRGPERGTLRYEEHSSATGGAALCLCLLLLVLWCRVRLTHFSRTVALEKLFQKTPEDGKHEVSCGIRM